MQNKCSDTEYISKWDPDSPGHFTRQMQRDIEAKDLGVSPMEYELHQTLIDEAEKYLSKNKKTNSSKDEFLKVIEKEAKKAIEHNPEISIDDWIAEIEKILKNAKNKSN